MLGLKRKSIFIDESKIGALLNDCDVTDSKKIKIFIFDSERKPCSEVNNERKDIGCASENKICKSVAEYCTSQAVVLCSFKINSYKLKTKSINQKLVHKSYYLQDIYQYLKEKERNNCPLPTYILRQPWISLSSRNIVIDALIYVTYVLEFDDNVLFLSVYYLDRFLSLVFVKGTKLAAVGFACLFIASKYEEATTDRLEDFVPFMKNICTKKEICEIERKILKTLGFDISGPTTCFFLECICSTMEVSDAIFFFALFILEMTLMEPDSFLKFLPSKLAASALVVATNMLDIPFCEKMLQTSSGYSQTDTNTCCKLLRKLYRKFISRPRRSIYEKYKSSDYLRVADLHTNVM
ncbi:cyclin-A1-like [Stegodyphus dumicola]|uniref:cyclin-A1-like n=1 Tax=Stegodyphus dumicola TaxID=202533 RepID=UPI0015B13F6D|nr:cyclin-A1-like [Stegodyphus dumicola]XP_035208348.1 cyclin-A1-like [Stegodyphus dumicola]XP_035208349.1 cyclin-A1-like [Stegodyphus dumicola]